MLLQQKTINCQESALSHYIKQKSELIFVCSDPSRPITAHYIMLMKVRVAAGQKKSKQNIILNETITNIRRDEKPAKLRKRTTDTLHHFIINCPNRLQWTIENIYFVSFHQSYRLLPKTIRF